jgi:PKD repeat protein
MSPNPMAYLRSTCVLLMLAIPAAATTIVMPTDEQLIGKSPVIVEGTVVSSAAVDRNGVIWTESRIRVTRAIKGTTGETIVVAEPGGILGDRLTKVFGTPEYADGERVLLFLERDARGDYRTMDLFVGKFGEVETLDGRRLWTRVNEAENVQLLDADLRPLSSRNVQRDAAKFETYVSERVAGRAGSASYGVENPILKPRMRVGSDFTLISEPTVYRWNIFENGQTANWYSHGTQIGYSGGGLAEVETAMAQWNGYTAAKISFRYAGTASGAPGGLATRNNINEILLNDPLNEIAGAWNRSTGGVVGQGGFTGVTSSAMWTAPFAADAAHPAGSMRAWNISEGNLVIQDGVSASNGISSTRLAEIISHEFGHTLGIGHSSDGSALMYATVSGGGPGLRDDDKVAARWLYPNGGATGPQPGQAPNAPTNLTATVNGSTATLTWTDNATTETQQSVYLAAGSGAFTRLGTVDPNIRSTTINGLASGSYRAYVTASNTAGESAASNTVTIAITQQVSASFSFSPQNGVAGVTTFTFYDESAGPVSSRTWSFGDGTSSTAAVAPKIYASAGQYTVTLTVNGGGTQSTTTRTVVVTGPLNAGFTFSPANPTVNDTVSFSDQSTGGVTGWFWTLGDGRGTPLQHPTHRYAAPGTYTVTLTVNRNNETKVATQQITVRAASSAEPAVTAAFDAFTTTPSINLAVPFYDRTSGAPTRWNWNFGDGNTSTSQNPVHTWTAPGTYTVTLVASNANSQSTATKTFVVSNIAAFESLVSATAQTSGIGGTAWRTELTVFNAGEAAYVDFLFLPSEGSIRTKRIFIPSQQSVTYLNALEELYGLSSGAGAIAIRSTNPTSTPRLKVSSRTFTGGAIGTYGQGVPDVTTTDLAETLYVAGMQSSSAYRTNVGLVNRTDADVPATLTLYDGGGSRVATANVTVARNSFRQTSLAALFPSTAGRTYDVLSMRVQAAAKNAVSIYASVVDNSSHDPVYIQAVPMPQTNRMIVPVVGRAPGANGTYWRSDVTFFNPATAFRVLTLRYAGITKSLALNGGDTVVLADVLGQMGVASGSGTLEMTWNGDSGPVVTSRTYTTVAGGGTYGQSIDPVVTFARESFVPGLRMTSGYRSNVGFVNGGDSPLRVDVRLVSPTGIEFANTMIDVPAKSTVQYAVAGLFPSASGTFTLQATANTASLFAYGSIVDNESGDPVFFAGR